jgi:anti-anti-sigma factor
MKTIKPRNVLIERVGVGVLVLRFVRPFLRDQLYEDAEADIFPLFRELFERALADLQENQTVILNLGLVEYFSAAFYRCLLKVREVVAARHAELLLCRLSEEHEEIFHLFRGFDLFRVTATERRAVHEAMRGSGAEGPPRNSRKMIKT